MYMRVVQAKMNPEKIAGIEKVYKEKIMPELQKTPGCLCARLIQSSQEPNEFLSMTLWDTQKHAEDYETSGLFQKLLNMLKPFMTDPTEWKIQLSEDFTLRYEPVEEEPVVTSYPVVEESVSDIQAREEAQSMHMRIVAPKIQPGKLAEFKKLYRQEIIPALQKVKGCRYAYLIENVKDETSVFSVTIWDSLRDAQDYEKSGLFDELTQKLKYTLSELYQWKMALEKDYGKKIATSDDLKVDHYNVVTGKRFR